MSAFVIAFMILVATSSWFWALLAYAIFAKVGWLLIVLLIYVLADVLGAPGRWP